MTKLEMTPDATSMDISEVQAVADYGDPLDFSAFLNANDIDSTSGFNPASHLDSATVSPHDLFLDDQSIPNSLTFTNLTTPSLYDDTPDMNDNYDVSPAFESNDMYGSGSWIPLFQDNNDALMGSSFEDSEPPSLSASTESLLPAMVRTSSSVSGIEPKADLLRHAVTAGIVKSSRRAIKHLGPIEVDDGDEQGKKRAKNTLAARKSRQKKRDVEDTLRLALDAMTAERDHWRLIAAKHGAPLPEV